MAYRDFILNNLRWKVTALVLAMLVWFVIKVAIYKGATGGREQILRRQSVLVLTAPDDPRLFRLEPAIVDVFIQGTKELQPDDVQVFVNLSLWPEGVNSALKQVLVRGTQATKTRVDPLFVMVERVSPPEATLRNSLKKP
jgi:hypothetical protein